MTSEHRTIETRLSELADHIDWPEGDVTAGVRQRIVAGPPADRGLRVGWKAAVAALAALVVVVALPAGRQAIADLLGVAGIEIFFTDDAPSTDSTTLDLGEPVPLEVAGDRMGLPIALPALSYVGAPDAIHLQGGSPVIVHATWAAAPGLPAVSGTDIGLLLTQFRTPIEQTVFYKELTESTSVEMTAVGDHPAQWIEGAPHQLTYQTTQGTQTRQVSRLAANVLIWESDGVTYRLESGLGPEAARRIAEALFPAGS